MILLYNKKERKVVPLTSLNENSVVKQSKMDRLLKLTENIDLDFMFDSSLENVDFVKVTDVPADKYEDFKKWFTSRANMLYYRKQMEDYLKLLE